MLDFVTGNRKAARQKGHSPIAEFSRAGMSFWEGATILLSPDRVLG